MFETFEYLPLLFADQFAASDALLLLPDPFHLELFPRRPVPLLADGTSVDFEILWPLCTRFLPTWERAFPEADF
jgi:hypothetical protein